MYPKIDKFVTDSEQDIRCDKCKNVAFTAQKLQPCGCQLCDYCALLCTNSCCNCDSPIIDIKSDELLLQELQNVTLYCGCKEKFNVNQILDHSKTCQQARLCCPNDCGEFIQNQDLKNHLDKTCNRRLVSCEYCGIILEVKAMNDHFMYCGRFKIACANGCGELIPRGDMNLHLETCTYAEELCPFCSKKYQKTNSNEHFSDMNLLGMHLMGISQTYLTANNQIQQIYTELNTKLTKIENSIGLVQKMSSSISQEPSQESNKIIPRTSLRVIPGGQTVGNERTQATLILPLEFRIRNKYNIVTAPPVEGSFLEIRNLISQQIIKIESQQTRTSVFYELSFTESGPFDVILRSKSGLELDSQDINVLPHEFDINNINNIGICSQYRAAHSWINTVPCRFFFAESEGIQIYRMRLARANTKFAIGFAQVQGRQIQGINSIFSKGIFVNGKFVENNIIFRAGDDLELKIDGSNASLIQNNKQIYLFENIESQSLFVELADAEVLLV